MLLALSWLMLLSRDDHDELSVGAAAAAALADVGLRASGAPRGTTCSPTPCVLTSDAKARKAASRAPRAAACAGPPRTGSRASLTAHAHPPARGCSPCA